MEVGPRIRLVLRSRSEVKQHSNSLSVCPGLEGRQSSFRSTRTGVKEMGNYAVHRLFKGDPEVSAINAIRMLVEFGYATSHKCSV